MFDDQVFLFLRKSKMMFLSLKLKNKIKVYIRRYFCLFINNFFKPIFMMTNNACNISWWQTCPFIMSLDVFFFLFLLSLLPKKYMLVFFVFGISISLLILFIFNFFLLILLSKFYLFSIQSFNCNLSYIILFNFVLILLISDFYHANNKTWTKGSKN